ncbi:BAH domain-containing protein [Mycena chlorophos]|uniref:BAH domain-containing protein n=1 Tax=Mycena chlorophos TaxID=658473 RepID=A0A8H6WIY0_MYCCL|nr:BAH domain-containing protein [Mycena chlorophos]
MRSLNVNLDSTMAKQKLGRKLVKGQVGGVLTDKEWAALQPFDLLDLEDDHGGLETFKAGDDVTLVHGTPTPQQVAKYRLQDYWVGKIQEIRGDAEKGEAWVKLNWYYLSSDPQLKKHIPAFQPSPGATFELLYSHHCESISVADICGKIQVLTFREDDPDQPPIPPETFFCRYYFDIDGGFSILQYLKAPDVDPTTLSKGKICTVRCTLCAHSYYPEEPDLDEAQRWCPAPTCRRGFHHGCLQDHRSLDLQKNDSDDEDSDVDMDDDTLTMDELVRARLTNHPDGDPTTNGLITLPSLKTLSALIPEPLLLLAAQPLVRGGVDYGIAGNLAAVSAARRLVLKHLLADADGDGDGDVDLENWGAQPVFRDWLDAIVEPLDLGTSLYLPPLIKCPNCERAI